MRPRGSIRRTLGFVLWMAATPPHRRHLGRWLRSRVPGYLLRSGTPWVVYDAIEHLAGRLPPAPKVFEYGSGASTVFWLRRGARVVSVEHDPAWFALVRRRIGPDPSLDYRLVEPRKAADGPLDPSDPDQHASSLAAYAGYSFREYVEQIDAFPDGAFDVVVVDGRARAACTRHAAPKVRRGGVLLLDNADRPHYTARLGDVLAPFERRTFWGVAPVVPVVCRTDCYWRR